MTSVHIMMAFLLGIHIAVSFILKCFNRTKNVREVKTRVEMSTRAPGSKRRELPEAARTSGAGCGRHEAQQCSRRQCERALPVPSSLVRIIEAPPTVAQAQPLRPLRSCPGCRSRSLVILKRRSNHHQNKEAKKTDFQII